MIKENIKAIEKNLENNHRNQKDSNCTMTNYDQYTLNVYALCLAL